MEAVILMGIQGCGKSTFFRERLFDTHIRINLDMLKTRHREKLLVEACLAAKQPFAVDNTNPTRQDRARYIPAAKAAGFRVVGYYFQSNLTDCRKRNEQRPNGKVIPFGGLINAYNKLELPGFDEGFDALYHVRVAPRGEFILEEWSEGIEKP
ncbi:MAG TPA: AAA family ATPase [Phycisphaerae bacterium]|nr:AAA family ATPase [Phycisphaerae bacterium]